MTDQIVHAMAHGGDVRIVAAVATGLVAEARRIHRSMPAATIALGELLIATALMARTLKGSERLTIQVQANGPLGLLLSRGDRSGTLYGTVMYPETPAETDENGRPDVGGAIGRGTLLVIRDNGKTEPWMGFVPVDGGEIADEIRAYYATSEQTTTAFGLRVELDRSGEVVAAGGFLAQLMGGLSDERRAELRGILHGHHEAGLDADAVTSAAEIAARIGGSDTRVVEQVELGYNCPIHREYYVSRIASLGRTAIDELFGDDGTIEVTCDFTRESWRIGRDEVDRLTGAVAT